MKKLTVFLILILILMFIFVSIIGCTVPLDMTTEVSDNEITANDTSQTLSAENDFSYSSATVTSGDKTIHPISCLVWTNKYVNGEADLCGDGHGYYHLVITKADHNTYPTLVLDKEITACTTTVGSSISQSVRIFNTDFEELDMNSDFSKLSTLPKGEYLIVFTENTDTRYGDMSKKDYWLSEFECVFKLLIKND